MRVDPDERRDVDPAVAAGANGRFVVAWASGGDILARTFDRRGAGGPVSVVSDVAARYGASPALASDAAGRFVAVWTALDFAGGRPRIILRELLVDGRPRGGVVAVGPGGWPDVAASPDGEVLVVWRSAPPSQDADQQVLGKRFRILTRR